MKLITQIGNTISSDFRRERKTIINSIRLGTKEGTDGLKNELQSQIVKAGMGTQLSKSWQRKFYENNGSNPAGFVYSKAPDIARAFDEGMLIRAKNKIWLAYPTENAPPRLENRRITPALFVKHNGPLRFVPRDGQSALLVTDNYRSSYSRKTGDFKGFRKIRAKNPANVRKGRVTIAMFVLVRQAKLPKTLNVESAASKWGAAIPKLIHNIYMKS
ncbi:MAG: hypothetical protein HYS17_03375 [Micavibrio aeruginosavorus]|uniref:Uncharacterized protein n=1 Tax=Micavibrio aeruginosavorus TaxID=349221 RepID=A0A7T5R3I5_9BACT|nr:MAG: hypothetical protein HYS17_03375 [Micavibrio aeruginosavorus]